MAIQTDTSNDPALEDMVAWMGASTTAVSAFFADVPVDRFAIRRDPAAWAPAEHLDHLIRSIRPVARALGLPRPALRLAFGAAPAQAESYAQLYERYLGLLRGGAGATGRFVPAAPTPSASPESVRHDLLGRWGVAAGELQRRLHTWPSRDLDRLALPHPLLGTLSVRGMLFFTHFHNRHHVNDVIGLLA